MCLPEPICPPPRYVYPEQIVSLWLDWYAAACPDETFSARRLARDCNLPYTTTRYHLRRLNAQKRKAARQKVMLNAAKKKPGG